MLKIFAPSKLYQSSSKFNFLLGLDVINFTHRRKTTNRKMALKKLSTLNPQELKTFLDSFDTVLTDCDGVLWIGNKIISGAPEVMSKFKALGKKVFYVTNNSSKTRDEFLDKFKTLGFSSATKEEIVSTAYLTANYLKSLNFNKKVYIVGSPGIASELNDVRIKNYGVGPDPVKTNIIKLTDIKLDPDVGAVVVGFDHHFSLPKMVKAASYLENKGTLFIATNTDERSISGTHVMPENGSLVAAIKTCSEREPFIVGKPEAYIRKYLIKEHKINPCRTIMIGDRCNTDILLGTRCGFQTLLVLTGVSKLEDVHVWKESNDKKMNDLVPDYYTDKIGDLLTIM